jgi:hypothetical protein
MAKCRFYVEHTKQNAAPPQKNIHMFKPSGERGRIVYCAHSYSPLRRHVAERAKMSWLLLPCGGIVERCTVPEKER